MITLFGTSLFSSPILFIAIMLFKIVAYWFLFEKAGEAGWKALIPVYRLYILYKLARKEKLFWVTLIAIGLALIAVPLIASTSISFLLTLAFMPISNPSVLFIILSLIIFAIYFAIIALLIIISIKVCMALAESFGQQKAFGVGLFFLETIFIGILAFGNCAYIKEIKQEECKEPSIEIKEGQPTQEDTQSEEINCNEEVS